MRSLLLVPYGSHEQTVVYHGLPCVNQGSHGLPWGAARHHILDTALLEANNGPVITVTDLWRVDLQKRSLPKLGQSCIVMGKRAFHL